MKEDNIKLWNELKAVPAAVKKKIIGGRLKGMTDIKPQWRLQMMTEAFGSIGLGWYYEVIKTWTEEHKVKNTETTKTEYKQILTKSNIEGEHEYKTYEPRQTNEVIIDDIEKEISVYVHIHLFIKDQGEWSKPIVGIGGSMLLAKEKHGIHHSDEAYKMATTDALSVAMKQLGIAADVYMGLSDSKYDKPVTTEPPKLAEPEQKAQLKNFMVKLENVDVKAFSYVSESLSNPDLTFDTAQKLIGRCMNLLGETK